MNWLQTKDGDGQDAYAMAIWRTMAVARTTTAIRWSVTKPERLPFGVPWGASTEALFATIDYELTD